MTGAPAKILRLWLGQRSRRAPISFLLAGLLIHVSRFPLRPWHSIELVFPRRAALRYRGRLSAVLLGLLSRDHRPVARPAVICSTCSETTPLCLSWTHSRLPLSRVKRLIRESMEWARRSRPQSSRRARPRSKS
ncbi:hypothetical protein AMAG_19603 [Allomyces macrogynus ATCC 38327]|uniref:Uncharacterized protein n=1 Tax=Allomyces macrogynus (strain ATCC 38327) TaxID=578462 RepID=A0A0L0SW79_ALLM3|nr:hypothetical protein AMAG_19603 [Allomyces macrogynus ATCC 38327]|eukprot:KNE66640.1 hypothetical protein AMAG_19603 [Allomyces macrogynus ATCC 38327]